MRAKQLSCTPGGLWLQVTWSLTQKFFRFTIYWVFPSLYGRGFLPLGGFYLCHPRWFIRLCQDSWFCFNFTTSEVRAILMSLHLPSKQFTAASLIRGLHRYVLLISPNEGETAVLHSRWTVAPGHVVLDTKVFRFTIYIYIYIISIVILKKIV